MLNCKSGRCESLKSNFPIQSLFLRINFHIWKISKVLWKTVNSYKSISRSFVSSLFFAFTRESYLPNDSKRRLIFLVFPCVWPSAGQHSTWSTENWKPLTDFEDLLSRFWDPIHYMSLHSKDVCAMKCDSLREIKSTHTCSKATPNSLTWLLTQTFLCAGQHLSGSEMAKK